ncbi:MAG: JAB domain-containing protein [Clostridia bacterium]|nr:JAB domain-containing protein [Clostridia bacterium]
MIGERAFKLDVVSIRLVKDAPVFSRTKITNPETAIEALGNIMSDLDREVVAIVNLKSDGTPINVNFASVGTINGALAEPRELLKSSILSNAANVIMVHNHPSGCLDPSKTDIAITNRMIEVFSLMGIPLLDHVIVGGDNRSFYSMHEKGTVVFDNHVVYSSLIDTLKFQRVAEDVPNGIVAADWRKETLGYGNVHEERVRESKNR